MTRAIVSKASADDVLSPFVCDHSGGTKAKAAITPSVTSASARA